MLLAVLLFAGLVLGCLLLCLVFVVVNSVVYFNSLFKLKLNVVIIRVCDCCVGLLCAWFVVLLMCMSGFGWYLVWVGFVALVCCFQNWQFAGCFTGVRPGGGVEVGFGALFVWLVVGVFVCLVRLVLAGCACCFDCCYCYLWLG